MTQTYIDLPLILKKRLFSLVKVEEEKSLRMMGNLFDGPNVFEFGPKVDHISRNLLFEYEKNADIMFFTQRVSREQFGLSINNLHLSKNVGEV